ncbi:7153_t:CDS:2, partial [Racocetra persica]
RKDFEAMQEYEQRILMERFARQIEQCEKNLDKIHDIEDEKERMFQEQHESEDKA